MKDNNYHITSDLIDCVKQEVELDGLNSNSIWIVVKSLKVNKDNRVKNLSNFFYFLSFRYINFLSEIISN